MIEPSLHARVCELLGEEPVPAPRPTVGQALATMGRGEVMAARRGAEPVAVVMLEDGRSFVAPDRCPHDGGRLSNGFVDQGRLVCARHGWEFELDTGACVGRTRHRLSTCPVDHRPACARSGQPVAAPAPGEHAEEQQSL
jgi:nitrite reductase/ring-hydroxylating ferredoxin subunit